MWIISETKVEDVIDIKSLYAHGDNKRWIPDCGKCATSSINTTPFLSKRLRGKGKLGWCYLDITLNSLNIIATTREDN